MLFRHKMNFGILKKTTEGEGSSVASKDTYPQPSYWGTEHITPLFNSIDYAENSFRKSREFNSGHIPVRQSVNNK